MSYKFRTIPSFDRDLKHLGKRYPSLEVREGTICFLALYDKAEQETISDKRIKSLLEEAGIK